MLYILLFGHYQGHSHVKENNNEESCLIGNIVALKLFLKLHLFQNYCPNCIIFLCSKYDTKKDDIMKRNISLLLLLFSVSVFADGLSISGSWGSTKTLARDQIYDNHNTTLYCGCRYTPSSTSGGQIDLSSCNYDGSNESHAGRASRLEWEHVVPASLMPARQMTCWTTGLSECSEPGRECCEKHDEVARTMIFDLHNLVPSIGQTNALRSNKRYGLIAEEERKLGACDFEWSSTLTEPAESIRGDVARAWLYMHGRHGLELLPGELSMFRMWSCNDLPDQWEQIRNERIRQTQGNGNPYIDTPC